MNTREFLFKGHPIMGRVFTMPLKIFAALFSGSAILLLLLPAWLVNIHLISCSSGNYGFWLKWNWSILYVIVLPAIFGMMIVLSSHLESGVLKLCCAPLNVITRKSGVETSEYPELLSARVARSARPIVVIALLLAVVILAADTRDLWVGFYYDNKFGNKVQPDWDTAYTGFAKDKYETYCKDTAEPCEQIRCESYSPPSKTANLLFDLLPYTFQGFVFYLAFFWVSKFYWFLHSFSALMRFEDSPYQFNPLDNPKDPDTRMGLRPMGNIFNGFLIITVLFQIYIFYYRIELVSLARHVSRWSYFKGLFTNLTSMDFAFGTGTVSAWLLIIFMNVPIVVICYFPLWTLYRYVRRRRYEAWVAHARAFADAVQNQNEELSAELEAKMNILQRANVWPNGDKTARRFLIIMVVLAVASIFPPLLPYLIGAGFTTEAALAVWARSERKDSMRTSPTQTLQKIFIEQVVQMRDQYNINHVENMAMRDQINQGKGIVITGDNAHVHDINFSEVWNQQGHNINLPELANQLTILREAMVAEAKQPAHYSAVADVNSAEEEAKKGNGPKALEYLSKAGQWALEVASKIAVPIASEAIKKSLGM
jgi:hypothetical protein